MPMLTNIASQIYSRRSKLSTFPNTVTF